MKSLSNSFFVLCLSIIVSAQLIFSATAQAKAAQFDFSIIDNEITATDMPLLKAVEQKVLAECKLSSAKSLMLKATALIRLDDLNNCPADEPCSTGQPQPGMCLRDEPGGGYEPCPVSSMPPSPIAYLEFARSDKGNNLILVDTNNGIHIRSCSAD